MITASQNHDRFRALTKILWDYNRLSQTAKTADLLLVMGTDDLGVPAHAAELDHLFNYPRIVISGGVFHKRSLHQQEFEGTEAEVFAKVMIERGVNSSKIMLEKAAANTGQNVTLAKEIVEKDGSVIKSGQLVHTPTMERRAIATAEKQWSDVQWCVSSQAISFEQYLEGLNEDRFIDGVVGDTFRVIDYPAQAYQTPQPMPQDVKHALCDLINAGFRRRIPNDFNPLSLRGGMNG